MSPSKLTVEEQSHRVVRHYKRLAPAYDRLWNSYSRKALGKLADTLAFEGHEHLLDVACGTGRLGAILRQRHPSLNLTGVDLSPAMIEESRRRLPEDERTRWLVGTLDQAALEPGSFDAISCASAFHLFVDQERALQQMARLVRPGGRVCIVDWCREYPQIQMIQKLARRFGTQYRNILNRDGMRHLMERAGLEVVAIERFKPSPFWGAMCALARRPKA